MSLFCTLLLGVGLTFVHGDDKSKSLDQGTFASPIEHVVLLMFENRAFDHMAGKFPNVNGLTGDETNPVNTSNPTGKRVKVQFDSPYIGPFDPNHDTPATTSKIFGQQGIIDGCKDPKMDGFIEWAVNNKHKSIEEASSLMNMFTPERLPVMYNLSQEFAIFDRFFCSHPGPTWPNRLFQLMGTSQGDTETSEFNPKTMLYKGRTVFDIVEEAGHDWSFYYADAPLEAGMIEKLTLHPKKIKGWRKWKKDVKKGKLPAFSWMNPRWFVNKTSNEGASDQHPDHDVRLGEALMKEVYEDLRSSPKWNSTLFIITYDEHGGFYDHVPPPMNIPAPDDSKSFPDKGFNFTRLGVRIPVLLISPWIPKGTVISEPMPSEKPAHNSEFDLTSVIATVKKLFNAPRFLTKRDSWAATFEQRLSRTSPRTDCPMHTPDAPKSLGRAAALAEAAQPLNDLQEDIVKAFATLNGQDITTFPLPKLQGDASEWISKIVEEYFAGKHILANNTKSN